MAGIPYTRPVATLRARQADEESLAVAEPASRRRRRAVACGVTALAWAVLMAWTLRLPANSVPDFYGGTVALAAVLLAGALVAGRRPSPSPDGAPTRQLVLGGAVGVALLVVFLVGAVLVAQIPVLRAPVQALLAHASVGSIGVVAVLTAVNGVAEEMFYRRALYEAVPPRTAIWATTLVYAASAAFAGIALLVLAAAVLGATCAVLRRLTRGIVASIACHLVWSVSLLFTLSPVLTALEPR